MSQAQKLLSIGSYRTVWLMAHKIRKAMADRDSNYSLSGIIELDDASFGKRPKGISTRHGTHQKAVRVAVSTSKEGRPAFAKMEAVEYADMIHAKQMAQDHFEPGQTIKTDGSKTFQILEDIGFKREAHKLWPNPKQAGIYLPWVHTLISNAKRFLQGTHHRESPKHTQRFLDEFNYRFNRRWWQGQLFDRLLTACTAAPSVTFAELSK